jgi:hypothetical protein
MHQSCSYGSAGAGEGNLPLYPDPHRRRLFHGKRLQGEGACFFASIGMLREIARQAAYSCSRLSSTFKAAEWPFLSLPM